jgi:predicted negative regulator of RcsB-dependent stress response
VEISRAEMGTRGHPFVSIVLARALLKAGSASEAEAAIETARGSGLEHPLIELTRGDVEKALGHEAESVSAYERASRLHPAYRPNCMYCPLF